MNEQSNTFDSQSGAAPRHGRHASSFTQDVAFDDAFNEQDVVAHSRHAAASHVDLPSFEDVLSAPVFEGPQDAVSDAYEQTEYFAEGLPAENAEYPANDSPHYEHDLSGLSEYTYGTPVEQPAPASYAYGVGDASLNQFEEPESVLPDNLRSKNGGAPRKVLKTIGKIILLLILFGVALGLGVLVGLVNLMDVNPLVLFALS